VGAHFSVFGLAMLAILSTSAAAAALLGAAPRNSALVFLKPHAANDACEKFVRSQLESAGVEILQSGVRAGGEIAELKLIDQHYGSLARLAMATEPSDIALSPAARTAFAEAYGCEWEEALPSMLRNDKALERLGVDGSTLEGMWRGGVQVKLAPGTYVSRLAGGDTPLYTVNGFYPAMRQAFVEPDAAVRFMVCEFDEDALSWEAFRQQTIGATNPANAATGSLRAELLSRWQELGLSEAPTQGLNGVHASAGPLEGLKERCVWAGVTIEADAFGSSLLEAGLARSTLDEWLEDNPVVTLGGETDKVFDLTEEKGAASVLEMVAATNQPAAVAAASEEAAPAPVGFAWGGTY